MDSKSRRWFLFVCLVTLFVAAAPAHAQPRPPAGGTPLQPYLAWTLAGDGTPYVLDARYRIWQLDPANLAPVQRSPQLVPAMGRAPAELLVAGDQIWVGAAVLGGTRILDRNGYATLDTIERFGPMAAGPDGEVYLIGGTGLYRYDTADLDAAPQTLLEPWKPDQFYGARQQKIAVDPAGRRLYLTSYNAFGSPPHNPESLLVADIDRPEFEVIDTSLGSYSRPSLTADGRVLAVAFNAKNGALGSWVGLWQDGESLRRMPLLDGQALLDPDGKWLYLLNDRGLWAFGLPEMTFSSVMPWLGNVPATLSISPDGAYLYLFGPSSLATVAADELQTLGLSSLTDLPTARGVKYSVFASPTEGEDGSAFALRRQPLGPDPYGLLLSRDSRQTWVPNLALSFPTFAGVDALSLSPAFASDGTAVASATLTETLFRSTDGGVQWDPWAPPIAYTAEIDGQRDIVFMETPGGADRRLTIDGADDENPAWSPAWTYIAFQSNRGGNWDIFTIRAGCDVATLGEEACGLRQLTDDPADDMLPAWSPDGRHIAFVSTRDGGADLFFVTLDDGSVQRVTNDPAGAWRPAWLPDSRHLLFTSARSGNNDLYAVRIPNGGDTYLASPVPVVATPADERDPAVSAEDGLLFVSDQGGTPAIYQLGAWALWDDAAGALRPSRVDEPYLLGAQTRHVAGQHPAWYPVRTGLPMLFAREADDGYAVLLGDFYSDTPKVLAEGEPFVGHPAAAPVFCRGETTP